jgi:hypothetical protein
MKNMKRPVQTLLAFAAMIAIATPAIASKKEERFALTSAVEQTHRTDNTAAHLPLPSRTRKTRCSLSVLRR